MFLFFQESVSLLEVMFHIDAVHMCTMLHNVDNNNNDDDDDT